MLNQEPKLPRVYDMPVVARLDREQALNAMHVLLRTLHVTPIAAMLSKLTGVYHFADCLTLDVYQSNFSTADALFCMQFLIGADICGMSFGEVVHHIATHRALPSGVHVQPQHDIDPGDSLSAYYVYLANHPHALFTSQYHAHNCPSQDTQP